MFEKEDSHRIKDLSTSIQEKNRIDKELFDKYDIRHGLRNNDGTGVLVGITRIGFVTGYEKIDGKKIATDGSLLYRGYSITDLVNDFLTSNRFGFEETTYLLLFGQLPNKEQLAFFQSLLIKARQLPKNYLEDVILRIPGKNIMNKIMRSLLTLYSYDSNPESTDTENVLQQSISLIAKVPLLMAYAYQAKKHYIDGDSLVIHYPNQYKSTAENILHLIRPQSEYTDQEAKLLDLMLVLHAEHGGGNNSTFATHVVSSTETDTYSVIATALGSLKGPRHGGANLMVVSMLDEIASNIRNIHNEEDIEDYLKKILEGKAFDGRGLLYGMGHAVYTKSDPRTGLLKQQAKKVAEDKGYLDEYHFLELIESIGGRLLQERNKTDYPICANVDFYAGFVYQMLGIPRDLYTPLFATSRMAGWCSHRLEQIQDSKIIRPAYVHLNSQKKYLNLNERC